MLLVSMSPGVDFIKVFLEGCRIFRLGYCLPILVSSAKDDKKSLWLSCQYLLREGQRVEGPAFVKRFIIIVILLLRLSSRFSTCCMLEDKFWWMLMQVPWRADFAVARWWVVVNVVKTACGENALHSLRRYNHTNLLPVTTDWICDVCTQHSQTIVQNAHSSLMHITD